CARDWSCAMDYW
nr:immunoglobulin heavy chain junction region [Mus musculus]